MKDLSNIKSLKELRKLKLQAKHELELEKLTFENSKLKLNQELDMKRIMPDLSSLLLGSIQKTFVGSILKKFKG